MSKMYVILVDMVRYLYDIDCAIMYTLKNVFDILE